MTAIATLSEAEAVMQTSLSIAEEPMAERSRMPDHSEY
jgi:hypothetical protein